MIEIKKLLLYFAFALSLSLTTFYAKAENSDHVYLELNYGISTNEFSVTSSKGDITTDEEDEGFIISAGRMFGGFWGVDIMYYDLGSSSITVDSGDIIKMEQVEYVAESSGTISNDISGYGTGLILGNTSGPLTAYLKIGMQAWEKGGSSTILDNDDGFKKDFYNKGLGGYGGIGIAFNLSENTAIDLSGDIIGLSNDGGFSNNSSLLSAGLRFSF